MDAMIVNAGPHNPVPTPASARRARAEAGLRSGASARNRRETRALVPAGERRDHPVSRQTPRRQGQGAPGRSVAEAAAAAAFAVQSQAGPARRGLRAEASERARYQRAYAEATSRGLREAAALKDLSA